MKTFTIFPLTIILFLSCSNQSTNNGVNTASNNSTKPKEVIATLLKSDADITLTFNDKELFLVRDETFTQAGKVGLRTKADAVTYFDDFEITTIKRN